MEDRTRVTGEGECCLKIVPDNSYESLLMYSEGPAKYAKAWQVRAVVARLRLLKTPNPVGR